VSIAAKALWLAESNLRSQVSLENMAESLAISRFHLLRLFGLSFGMPLMRYVRSRRLSIAAVALAAGDVSILEVALDAGYSSHEAFTRGFGDQFGHTPESIRLARNTTHLKLMEPYRMTVSPSSTAQVPHIQTQGPLFLVGISARHPMGAAGEIPEQWQRFQSWLGHIPGQKGKVAYGVCQNFDDDNQMDYLCAVEVASSSEVPAELTSLKIAAQSYAVSVMTATSHRSEEPGLRSFPNGSRPRG
jgi:AraC family transcriptional regulator